MGARQQANLEDAVFVLKVYMIYHMSQDFRGKSGNLGGISPPNSSEINTVVLPVVPIVSVQSFWSTIKSSSEDDDDLSGTYILSLMMVMAGLVV